MLETCVNVSLRRETRMEVNGLQYLNFRIENQWVKDGKVVDGWFILGQRSTDLNWSLLHEAASFEGAKEFIRGILESADQLVYDTDGYTINI